MPRTAIGKSLQVLTFLVALTAATAFAADVHLPDSEATPELSGGAAAVGAPTKAITLGPYSRDQAPLPPMIQSAVMGAKFLGPNFDTNPMFTGGFLFIPPDPHGAAGPTQVIDVVNVLIESRNKAGALLWQDDLAGFFAPLAPCALGTFTFDPKVVYDHYAGRFVVVTLEVVFASPGANPSASNLSRILLAVSKTSTPATGTAADWWFCCIDSKVNVGGANPETFADYPGFEVDEDAVYITANMFRYVSGAFGAVRLWIAHKGLGTGGWYDGGGCVNTVHNPYTAAGSVATTTMPAQVYGAGGAGPGIGTYLVSYSGLSNGVDESVQVVRVDNPLGAVAFTQEFVVVGNIELLAAALPDAPQPGTAVAIEVNDRRALDAVWRNNSLWLTTTINPDGPALPGLPDHTTAYWFRLSTGAVASSASPAGLLTVVEQGGIPGEELAPGSSVFTYFPAVAVNAANEAKFGFSASSSTLFGSACATGRRPADPAGTTRPASILHAGTDFYVRTFDAPPCQAPAARNRWGDYSGASVDPADDTTFWIFNEMAIARGTPTAGGCVVAGAEDGRWGTCWAQCAFPCTQISCPPDLVVGNGFGAGSVFQLQLCFSNCGTLTTTYNFMIGDSQGWCTGAAGNVVLAPGAMHCETITCNVPGPTPGGTMSIVTLGVEPVGCPQDAKSCTTKVTVDGTVPVAIEGFEASAGQGGVELSWRLGANWREELVRLELQRADVAEGPYVSVGRGLEPAREMSYVDRNVQADRDYWYRLVTNAADGAQLAGPIHVAVNGESFRTTLRTPFVPPDDGAVQIGYSLSAKSRGAQLAVYDVRGHMVRELGSSNNGAGNYVASWDRRNAAGGEVAQGVYFVNLVSDGKQLSEKFLLIRH